MDNSYLFGLQKISFVDKLFQVPFELEWNHVEVTYESALYILLNFFWHDYTTSLIIEPLMANEFSSSDGGAKLRIAY